MDENQSKVFYLFSHASLDLEIQFALRAVFYNSSQLNFDLFPSNLIIK
jgi:hypothetical protein